MSKIARQAIQAIKKGNYGYDGALRDIIEWTARDARNIYQYMKRNVPDKLDILYDEGQNVDVDEDEPVFLSTMSEALWESKPKEKEIINFYKTYKEYIESDGVYSVLLDDLNLKNSYERIGLILNKNTHRWLLERLSEKLSKNLEIYINSYIPYIIDDPDNNLETMDYMLELINNKSLNVATAEKLHYYLAMFEFNSSSKNKDYDFIIYHLYKAGTTEEANILLYNLFKELYLENKPDNITNFNRKTDLLMYLIRTFK